MTKQEILTKAINKLGFEIGCLDPMVEKLPKAALDEVIKNIPYASTDIDVKIRGKLHVVEIVECDREIDIDILTQSEYIDRYGNERWCEE